MWTIKELKAKGKQAMSANYGMALIVSIIMTFTIGGAGYSLSSSWGNIASIFEGDPDYIAIALTILAMIWMVWLICELFDILVLNPLEVGCQNFFIRNAVSARASREGNTADGGPAGFDCLSVSFRPSWLNNAGTLFLRDLFIMLWGLLFIIPGIIKGYSYMLTPYIMAEHPEMKWTEAITLSRKMMKGHKWHAFCMDLSFIGWEILALLTCCILAVLYVNPYVYCTRAELYLTLKENYTEGD